MPDSPIVSFNLPGIDAGVKAVAEAVAQIYVTARTTQSQAVRDYWDARMAEVDYNLRDFLPGWKKMVAVDEAFKKLSVGS